MINCPLETQILLKFSQALNKTELNKGITKHIFEELQNMPNKKEINYIIQTIVGMVSDDNAPANIMGTDLPSRGATRRTK